MAATLRLRRLAGPLLRATAPGFTCCRHCGWPWLYATGYSVQWDYCGFTMCCTFCRPYLQTMDAVKYAVEILYGLGIGWRWNERWIDPRAIREVLQHVCAEWDIHGSHEVSIVVDQAWKHLREHHPWQ
jgi:hypothetical protein